MPSFAHYVHETADGVDEGFARSIFVQRAVGVAAAVEGGLAGLDDDQARPGVAMPAEVPADCDRRELARGTRALATVTRPNFC